MLLALADTYLRRKVRLVCSDGLHAHDPDGSFCAGVIMNGNSFLVLVSVGVIGLGSAMPYWSSYQIEPETSSTETLTEFQGGYATNQPPDLTQPKPVKMDAFIGDQKTNAQNPALQQQAMRSAYQPFAQPSRGLDHGAAIPELSSRYSAEISAPTKNRSVSFSPDGYQKVALAQRTTRQSQPRKVVPISLSQEEEEYYHVAKPVTQPKKVARAMPQRRVSFDPPAVRQKHKITDGDTLEALAQKFLQDPQAAWAIYEANRELLESPDLLPIGATLEIPVQSELAALKAQVKQRPVTNVSPVVAPQPVVFGQPQTHLVPIRH
ncbi:MAG: hypothetical protein COA78_36945 [Blastopirellula sp.]|nr:MAG: hypothetical protein COA78_36945 [Blastopirellula sp.]